MRRQYIFVVGCCAFFVGGGSALAGFTNLGGNWRAEWDDSLDQYVDVSSIGPVDTPHGRALIIEKAAEFTQPSVNGQFPAIPITFRQFGISDVEFIVIEDEIIVNSTGEDWTNFHIQLLDSGDAVFRPDLTGGGTGPIGWTISPFTQAEFANNNEDLNIWGGVVPDGFIWRPGDQGGDGQLWIDIVSGQPGDFTTFTLKETPSIPAPAAIMLLGLAGLRRRRRRRD